MNEFDAAYRALFNHKPLRRWLKTLSPTLMEIMQRADGHYPRFRQAFESLPELQTKHFDINSDTISVGTKDDLSTEQHTQLETALRELMPWRKGPFRFFDIFIDTEWHSDWKWQRIKDHISDLQDRLVLDVGCGSGYHCWRMAGSGAKMVIGIDPSKHYYLQFKTFQKYLPEPLPVHFLPLALEDVTPNLMGFDTVFSMGVLYHRRSPFDHLQQLAGCLRKGGEVVLETLVIDGKQGEVLVPDDRYAKMRNVWFLPSIPTLTQWMERMGFSDIKVVDITPTTVEEQRSTDWMQNESLPDFLDPDDHSKTIEGYPAPLRATFIGTRN